MCDAVVCGKGGITIIRRLPDTELEVMQAVWNCTPPVSRADIEHVLNNSRPLAVTTILTILNRLVEKRFLAVEKSGRSNCYTPLISRHDYLASQSRRFVDRLCGGSMSAFAAALCDSGLSKEDIAELRRLLERNEL
jgi:BlaI family penicillinase repressor